MARILIVDDEKSIRVTLNEILREGGYEVETAGDAKEALESLQRGTIDILVSDIILPRTNGIDLMRQIRGTWPRVLVLLMTGEPTVYTAVEAVRAGAFDYLCKPVTKDAILHAVGNAARLKALDDERERLAQENRVYQEKLEGLVEERTLSLKKTVDELKSTQKQIIQQERLSALGQMASGIAHDFNNVLMPIIGFSELLMSDPAVLDDRKETNHMLSMIISAGNDARQIVRRLRAVYSKGDDSDQGIIDMVGVVESAISLTMPKWKEELRAKGIAIEMVTDFHAVLPIKGNESAIREALTNLIFNAVDAMPEGGTITFRLYLENKLSVVLEVTDTGHGMEAETLLRCMEPFFTTKGTQGSGLGLAMVHGIVERHGGRMEVESKPGLGTTIRMRFPVPVDAVKKKKESDKGLKPLPSMRILVIDDEERSRDLVARWLRRDGHHVDLAEGGREGIDLLRKGPFDFIVTDRAMPSIRGDAVAIEAQIIKPGIPVIMLTGFGDIMKDSGELPAGVSRVMAKPVTQKELRLVMGSVMSKKRMKDET